MHTYSPFPLFPILTRNIQPFPLFLPNTHPEAFSSALLTYGCSLRITAASTPAGLLEPGLVACVDENS